MFSVLSMQEKDCGKSITELSPSNKPLITNEELKNSPCAPRNSPVRLLADEGQSLDVGLINFQHSSSSNQRSKKCVRIRDVVTSNEVEVCGGVTSRVSNVFTSIGHEIDVTILSEECNFALELKGEIQKSF